MRLSFIICLMIAGPASHEAIDPMPMDSPESLGESVFELTATELIHLISMTGHRISVVARNIVNDSYCFGVTVWNKDRTGSPAVLLCDHDGKYENVLRLGQGPVKLKPDTRPTAIVVAHHPSIEFPKDVFDPSEISPAPATELYYRFGLLPDEDWAQQDIDNIYDLFVQQRQLAQPLPEDAIV